MKLSIFLFFITGFVFAQELEFYQVENTDYYHESISFHGYSGKLYEVSAHQWRRNYKDLIVIVHGYTDSCGYFKPMTKWFLDHQRDVICVELPGHGTSSGPQADIDQIKSYQRMYFSLSRYLAALSYQSITLYAHSTGALGFIQSSLDHDRMPFSKVILAAPLVRSYLWDLSVYAYNRVGRYVSKLPKRSSYSGVLAYDKIRAIDPRPIRWVPTHWFAELIEWNAQLVNDERSSGALVHLIFGSKDTVIDTNFNSQFLLEKFPRAKRHDLKGSDHVFHFEEKVIQEEFYSILEQIIFLE